MTRDFRPVDHAGEATFTVFSPSAMSGVPITDGMKGNADIGKWESCAHRVLEPLAKLGILE